MPPTEAWSPRWGMAAWRPTLREPPPLQMSTKRPRWRRRRVPTASQPPPLAGPPFSPLSGGARRIPVRVRSRSRALRRAMGRSPRLPPRGMGPRAGDPPRMLPRTFSLSSGTCVTALPSTRSPSPTTGTSSRACRATACSGSSTWGLGPSGPGAGRTSAVTFASRGPTTAASWSAVVRTTLWRSSASLTASWWPSARATPLG
mmetsp:Transcript_6932/g.23841  ORF Transcript_6932/g.23841 Transcript_6932/m.23841 type:complete len:202 (+) Transcript_6932:812-1417(+)